MNIKSALIGALIAAVCLGGLAVTTFDNYSHRLAGALIGAVR